MIFKMVKFRAKSKAMEWSFEIMKEGLSQALVKATKIKQIKAQLK